MKNSILTMLLFIGILSSNIASELFPIGVYSAPLNGSYFAEMKEAGINIVHSYAATGTDKNKSMENTQILLENATKHQLQVMLYLRCTWWSKQPSGISGAMNSMQPFQNHPAVVMCLLDDEPKEKMLEEIIQLNSLVKASTPRLKTMVVEQWNTGWWRYGEKSDSCDILMIDAYPIGDKQFPESDMINYSHFMSAGLKRNKPIIPVIQICNLKNFPIVVEQRKYDANQCRFPNAIEIKFMTWSTIVQGAAGIFYFSFERALQGDPKGNWLRSTFFPITKELREFSILVTPLQEITKKQSGIEDSFFAGYWKRPQGEFLVITNNRPEKQICQISLPNTDFQPWGNTRITAILQDGNIELEPWETVIFNKEGDKK